MAASRNPKGVGGDDATPRTIEEIAARAAEVLAQEQCALAAIAECDTHLAKRHDR